MRSITQIWLIISQRYIKYLKEIDSLNGLTNNEDKIKLLNKVQSDIEDAY